MAGPFASYRDFWRHYLAAHADPRNRALHAAGTFAALVLLGCGALAGDWRPALAAPVVGYAAAWTGHFLCEGNRPATFGHPLWSLVSDFRMLALLLAGRLPDTRDG